MPKVEVARAAGVTGPSYQRWEDGEVVPDVPTVAALARFLRCSPGWLAFGEGPSPTALADIASAADEVAGEPRPPRG